MATPTPLPADALFRRQDPAAFAFETTSDLPDVPLAFGQDRALAALRFGLSVRRGGYNLFVLGPEGSGKHAIALAAAAEMAAAAPVPSPWVYLHNFEDPRRPRAVALPPGRAETFREGLESAHGADALAERYAGVPAIRKYLEELPPDAVGHRRAANVLVDHGSAPGAPVVYEDDPTLHRLCGCIEYRTDHDAKYTDHTLIRPGALHRANGGFLILDAAKIDSPFAWDELKRALRTWQIRVTTLGHKDGTDTTESIDPEPIPLDIKVILLGDRPLFYALAAHDPDFAELFKVVVDLEDDIERTDENTALYARWLATLARRERARPLDRTGVARLVEHAARLAWDAGRLTLHVQNVSDLLREADHWAGAAGRPAITAADVQSAIDLPGYRAGRIRERVQRDIGQGTVLIDTDGAKVGQVNGLTVILLGPSTFGRPARITASVRAGRGEVIDIERRVTLGGPIHAKGVLILQGFIGGRFGRERPLSLFASLVFEQSYAGIDGDSASLAEACALLSALSSVPIRQSLAVTGSVNQLGQVQPVGGVNEKIEGFFDVCKARGLTGEHGVVIPAGNARHLMLRRDVVDAASKGLFHVYPAATVDEAIELLTGIPAGERTASGSYPPGTLNHRASDTLADLARRSRPPQHP